MNTFVNPPLVRPELLAVQPVVHGSVAASELTEFGLTPERVLDFSVNTNPLGPAPGVIEAIRATDWSRYPGDDEVPLRSGLAREAGVLPENVALGNGSAELLSLIALATLRPGDRVAVVGPTFGEYARACRAVGAKVCEVQQWTETPPTRMIFVCNPNNPTGEWRSEAQVSRLLEQAERIVVLDEAYIRFAPEAWSSAALLDKAPNLIVVRSLTKDHALPGLRLGYALASAHIARALEAVRPPWSVNAGALRAGLAALQPDAQEHVRRARGLVVESRALLSDGLRALGYQVEPSSANFVLVRVGNAERFRRALLPRGAVVRDCTSFNLPAHVRIACRPLEECRRLLSLVGDLQSDPAIRG
jgi:histidinol-phosphate aminotransferase